MNTFKGENKVDFILQGLRVAEEDLSTDEWWMIINGAICQVKDMIQHLLGYMTIKDMFNGNDPIEHVTRENEAITVFEKGIGPQTRYFPIFNEEVYDNNEEGLVKHILLRYDGKLMLWQEKYRTPKERMHRVLEASNFSLISLDGFRYLSERQQSRNHGILGAHILIGIATLLKSTVNERERRLNHLKKASDQLLKILTRVDCKFV